MIPSFLNSFGCLFLAEEDHGKTGSAVLAVVKAEDIVKMAEGFLAAGYHLEDVSGLDVAEGAVSVYHFDHFEAPGRVTVFALRPHGEATFPSIAAVYQGAEWHERETRDFYGYAYENNPNFIPLLLADDMMDCHPLVKEDKNRVPLRALFGAENRTRTVVEKCPSFTLFDDPEPETAPASAEAGKGGDDA